MTPEITVALLLGAVILLVAVGAMRLSLRLGLPVLLIYLALGMAVGSPVSGSSSRTTTSPGCWASPRSW